MYCVPCSAPRSLIVCCTGCSCEGEDSLPLRLSSAREDGGCFKKRGCGAGRKCVSSHTIHDHALALATKKNEKTALNGIDMTLSDTLTLENKAGVFLTTIWI